MSTTKQGQEQNATEAQDIEQARIDAIEAEEDRLLYADAEPQWVGFGSR